MKNDNLVSEKDKTVWVEKRDPHSTACQPITSH